MLTKNGFKFTVNKISNISVVHFPAEVTFKTVSDTHISLNHAVTSENLKPHSKRAVVCQIGSF